MSEINQPLYDKSFYENELPLVIKEMRDLIAPNSIILLSGDLASGKTTWVSQFCREMGLEYVQSPTYAIHQRYQNREISIDHFDLYRLETEDELQAAGLYDLLDEPADYKMIEWPERINLHDLPLNKPVYALRLEKTSDGERRVVLRLLR